MPHLGGDGKGALYAKVEVVLPAELSPEERELFEKLKAARRAGEATA
jgi:DnaJ-class molecular chaperone